jgi:hypothetical protein
MATHATRPGARVGPERSILQWVGPTAVVALTVHGSGFASLPAAADPRLCGDRDQILEQLKQNHNEQPNALGLSADGGVLELLVSPEGGWTILVTYPQRPTCVVAVGRAWEALQKLGEQA